MIQDKPTFWNTIFVTKGVMKFSILWLSNKRPMIFPQLMHIIPTAYGTYFWTIISLYQILILNIEINFNDDYKFSDGLLILFDVWNIILWKLNRCMSSIIFFPELFVIVTINFFIILWGSFFSIQFFSCADVSKLSLYYWINAEWYISLICSLIYSPKLCLNASLLSLYYVDAKYVCKPEQIMVFSKVLAVEGITL